MHIAHVNFAKGFRGGERQTLNLIEGLAHSGIEQTLICRTGSELNSRAEAAGIKTRQVQHPALGHLAVPIFNLIHVHEARGAYWAAIEFALRDTPYLITRRVLNLISSSKLTHKVYDKAAALVGVSSDVARILSKQTGRHVHTIFDSCTVHQPQVDRVAAIRKKLGGKLVVGHVGALFDRQKGQSVLIEAFHQFCVSYPDARLVLLGDGPDKESFQLLAKNDARIIFAGFQDDVGSWLAAMDIFAFPSREEGLGSSVLDAMLLGVPVIASSVGGLPELTGANERGLLVETHDPDDWNNALRRLASDQILAATLREAAQQFALQNNVDAMSRRYLVIYDQIVAKARITPA
jgi:glycosyltransferase involved in cell wall biosynthesis